MVTLLEKEKKMETSECFVPWMPVERKSQCNQRSNDNITVKNQAKEGASSQFNALSSLDSGGVENGVINIYIFKDKFSKGLVF